MYLKKKNIFTVIVAFSFASLYSQVGIGTTSPDASSILDIKSANAGLLIPRVSLRSTTDVVTIANPATSLLVYNTSSVSDVTPGFYYWDTYWKAFKENAPSFDSSNSWNLTGNTLSTGNEYLGTNNFNSLVFKVNNIQVGKFHPNGGISLGQGAVANDNSSIAIGRNASALTSNEAIALGYSANSSGYQSVALGYNALASNNSTVSIGKDSKSSGYQSMALGFQASSTNNSNVSIGNDAKSSGYLSFSIGTGANSTNNNALAVGNNSTATGQQSTALGTESTASGQNATAIGYQATATQSNSIILGNSSNSNNKVGIGTNTPDERLHIAGSIKIVDGTQGVGKVLTSDANGKASWADSNTTKSYGELYRNSSTALTSGAIPFNSTGANYEMNSMSTPNIQVKTTGLYRVSYTISIKKTSGGTAINPEFYLTNYGTEIPGTRTYATLTNGDTRTVSMVKLVNLNAYQAVSVYSSLADSNTNLLSGCNLVVEFIK